MIRHIVLIVIDCLRADHVQAYGYHRPTTPVMDALASEGMLWTNAYSTSSWTRPSVTSLLTGLYPSAHGVFQGIKRSKGRLAVTTDVLPARTPTIADVLSSTGWRCGAFVNNAQLGEFTGLDRGFHTYIPTAGKADRLLDRFAAWLAEDRETPTFSYLHFLEAHWPYKPRRRHITMFGGDRDTNFFRDYSARDFGRLRRDVSQGEAVLTDEQLTHMVQMYDGAVRRLDGKIKIVLRMLEDLGMRDDTAIVVTADHGEEFLDHGHIGHGQSLREELTHVPLVMWIPRGPKGHRWEHPVSHTDLAHTLAGFAGDAADSLPGADLRGAGGTGAVFCELCIRGRYTQSIRSGRWKLYRQLKFDLPEGGHTGSPSPFDWTKLYPYTTDYELFDLHDDPGERRNLANQTACRSMRDRLVTELDSWWAETAASVDYTESEIDDVVIERLRDLGYID